MSQQSQALATDQSSITQRSTEAATERKLPSWLTEGIAAGRKRAEAEAQQAQTRQSQRRLQLDQICSREEVLIQNIASAAA